MLLRRRASPLDIPRRFQFVRFLYCFLSFWGLVGNATIVKSTTLVVYTCVHRVLGSEIRPTPRSLCTLESAMDRPYGDDVVLAAEVWRPKLALSARLKMRSKQVAMSLPCTLRFEPV